MNHPVRARWERPFRLPVLALLTLLLLISGGCGPNSGFAATPNIYRGMTGDEVDRHCVQDCFPVFQLDKVDMSGGELHKVFRQRPMFGDGIGQLLFVTEKDGRVVDFSYMGLGASQ
jgi:hypothetical protein